MSDEEESADPRDAEIASLRARLKQALEKWWEASRERNEMEGRLRRMGRQLVDELKPETDRW